MGLTVFTTASVVCGLAQGQTLLIGARFVQGAGGALTSAVILGMIVTMFPEPAEQARAIGVYSFVASAGASIGLLAGGALTEAINWHWIFFVNLPIGVATGIVATRLLDRDEGIGLEHGADVAGARLVVSALMLGVYTIVGAGDRGWGSTHTLGLGAIAVALLAAFVAREARAPTPLMPLRIFRSRTVAAANLIQALTVLGIGAGLSIPALMTLAMSGATSSDSGLASGLANTTQQVGGALGLAVLTTLATTLAHDLLGDGGPRAAALTDGYHLAFAVGAGLAVAAIVLTMALLRPARAVATADAVAECA